MRKSRLSLSAAIVLVFVLTLVILFLVNRQEIYDWSRLYNYKAPSEITQLATNDRFTTSAKKVFYVNHPKVDDKSTFASHCPNGSKEAAVLGCYIPNQSGIYILNVNDPTLNGIEEVTAAHELLHAEYDRLSKNEKSKVNNWLISYYKSGLHDPNVISQINTYKRTEPNDLINEMHSVFGTEVPNLPYNLESYYKQYFKNRSIITGFYTKYESQFATRTELIQNDDAQLKAWKEQIDGFESDLQSKQTALTSGEQQLESYRKSNNINAYNSGVPAYNAQVNAYNDEVAKLHDLIDSYNQLVSKRNAIAIEEQQLVHDISSSTITISK